MNAVVLAVLLMLGLSLLRINVVIALVLSAIVGGLYGGLSLEDTIKVFSDGLGGGATIALNYAMLGAFAVAISKSGITDVLAAKVISKIKSDSTPHEIMWVKAGLLAVILCAAVASQNVVPVHIAFIPILIPPLLHVMAQLQLDRRLVACVLTFGLTATYMLLPVGFGGIFLNDILFQNLVENGATIEKAQLPFVMAIPVFGMFLGLLVAIFITYRKSREYSLDKILSIEPETKEINVFHIMVAVAAILAALAIQLFTGSIILGSLSGLIIFVLSGVVKYNETHDTFTKGVYMMGMIGFIMIAASGFADVMKATNSIDSLVLAVNSVIGDSKLMAALLMLLTGLLITMGIGSSFSTIPIIASIYVPMAMSFGFTPLAVAALVGTAGALGDAGSPASDSTLGPTSGLNVDGQHDHIWDSVVPTFLHYNIPLVLFGTAAALIL
ncbi:Na+/H+ antiporter family protein [Flocculibacter collagenilyticus]|uniref:Na+/H+ antiporter family protein n=1 Tax=Flocculibacter collagenilyticus TaxID=2744479 RepID=UPI0018F77207|nr:Na+/H+ antiporter NhaC family protein [Flocculibacter collagenilyticus]